MFIFSFTSKLKKLTFKDNACMYVYVYQKLGPIPPPRSNLCPPNTYHMRDASGLFPFFADTLLYQYCQWKQRCKNGGSLTKKASVVCAKSVCVTRLFLITQVDIPTTIGVGPGSIVAMETDKDPTHTTEKKYYIDPTFLYTPREGVEMVSPLKDGLSRLRDHRLTASSPSLPITQVLITYQTEQEGLGDLVV